MEDIRVGEYIRTIHGIIGKVIDRISREYLGKVMIDATYRIDVRKEDYSYKTVDLSQIKKHSFELKELLEKGDYVNGHKVYESDDGLVIFNIDDFEYFVNPMGLDLDKYRVVLEWQDENYIKNILTKEQFDREKYVVGG